MSGKPIEDADEQTIRELRAILVPTDLEPLPPGLLERIRPGATAASEGRIGAGWREVVPVALIGFVMTLLSGVGAAGPGAMLIAAGFAVVYAASLRRILGLNRRSGLVGAPHRQGPSLSA